MTLANFTLSELHPYLKDEPPSTGMSEDFLLMFVGRDNVHGALKYILDNVTRSLYMNMFGYDDEELNTQIMALVHDPAITVLITLDKSQAGGVHEKKLLDADAAAGGLELFNTHFVVGESATHQISHTKGLVVDGSIAGEGSTNWSASGEGTFVIKGEAGGPGYKAQNNTQTFFTDPYFVQNFQAELIREHMEAQTQARKRGA